MTSRTLHFYEEIGLVVASGRTPAGHRLYADGDVQRLYRVCLLRRLGLPLAEIGRVLDDRSWNLRAAMKAHLREVEPRRPAVRVPGVQRPGSRGPPLVVHAAALLGAGLTVTFLAENVRSGGPSFSAAARSGT